MEGRWLVYSGQDRGRGAIGHRRPSFELVSYSLCEQEVNVVLGTLGTEYVDGGGNRVVTESVGRSVDEYVGHDAGVHLERRWELVGGAGRREQGREAREGSDRERRREHGECSMVDSVDERWAMNKEMEKGKGMERKRVGEVGARLKEGPVLMPLSDPK